MTCTSGVAAVAFTKQPVDQVAGNRQHSDLKVSNALGKCYSLLCRGPKKWLFIDTSKGAHANAASYSLIETTKMNDLNPQSYQLHVQEYIVTVKTVEQLECLLVLNVRQEASALIRTVQSF